MLVHALEALLLTLVIFIREKAGFKHNIVDTFQDLILMTSERIALLFVRLGLLEELRSLSGPTKIRHKDFYDPSPTSWLFCFNGLVFPGTDMEGEEAPVQGGHGLGLEDIDDLRTASASHTRMILRGVKLVSLKSSFE